MQVVGGQQQITCLRGCTVCFGVATLLSQSVAVTKFFYVFINNIQGLDTQFFKGTQFVVWEMPS